MKIRVAGAQIPVTRDIESNLKAIHRAIDFALAEKADVLLTPEGSLSGYTWDFDSVAAEAGLADVTARAREAGLALALGTCFAESTKKIYNQIRFYEKDGRFLGFHSKTLTCGSMEPEPKGEVEHYAVKPLGVFDLCDVRIGGLICNDMWANPQCTPMPDPHLSQRLSRLGARIIFHAVNGGSRGDGDGQTVAWNFHESNLRMRAKAGGVWVVTVDNGHPVDQSCSAPSGVIRPDGTWAVQADPVGEQCFVHDIDLGE